MHSDAVTSVVFQFSFTSLSLSPKDMAATTISTRRPNLRKVLLSLSFFSSLVSAQTPPTYGSVPASSCPGAPDGTNVTVNGGSVYSIYCGSDINGQLAIVPDITTVSEVVAPTSQAYVAKPYTVVRRLPACMRPKPWLRCRRLGLSKNLLSQASNEPSIHKICFDHCVSRREGCAACKYGYVLRCTIKHMRCGATFMPRLERHYIRHGR